MSLDENDACYVFQPTAGDPDGSERPTKKRKTTKPRQPSRQEEPPFPCLLDGRESLEHASLRHATFETIWTAKEKELNSVLDDANHEIASNVSAFIYEGGAPKPDDDRIATGIVAAGFASTATGSLYSTVCRELHNAEDSVVVSIAASQCSNLKAALRLIIQSATQRVAGGADDDEPVAAVHRGTKFLAYDLELLHEWVEERALKSVVLFFQDAESFDARVFAELVDILSSWSDRIPFVLIFEVASSLDLFEARLPRKTLSLLRTTVFEAKTAAEILDILFRAATDLSGGRHVWLGPAASKMLLDRQTEHIQSAGGFIFNLKYMYLMHFFNNPLSILLADEPNIELSTAQCKAIRDLPSFQRYVQDLVDDGQDATAAALSGSIPNLDSQAPSLLQKSRAGLDGLLMALRSLSTIHSMTDNKSPLTWSALYIKAMSGELAEGPLVRELCLSVKKMSSDKMLTLLESLSGIVALNSESLLASLSKLLARRETETPLRSEHDVQHSTVRTTVVAQRVSLSTHKEALSAQDAEYSKLVNRIDLELRGFFAKHLIKPRDLCLNEVLIFDSRNACRDALGPAPRSVVERALSSPHDYLACDCCAEKEGLAGSQPTTALLYQMYLESGHIINVADLWAAYQAIMEPEDDGKERRSEDELLALFYRSLAELRCLGMVKTSRRKADHLAKLKWKGL